MIKKKDLLQKIEEINKGKFGKYAGLKILGDIGYEINEDNSIFRNLKLEGTILENINNVNKKIKALEEYFKIDFTDEEIKTNKEHYNKR